MKKITFLVCALAFATVACKQTTQKNESTDMETTKTFKRISPKEIQDNPVKMIDDDWMLISAGNKDSFNMMTASWGTIGNLWNKPVAVIFVRPQRYTYEFTENGDYFTLTVFEEKYRDILQLCGTTSGRDTDKVKVTGLKPVFTDLGNVYYEQARLVIECRKIYADLLKEDAFFDKTITEKTYPTKDFHKVYVGEILNVWVKE